MKFAGKNFLKWNVKTHFFKKYREYKYNDSINVLNNNASKTSKKEKGVGRKVKKADSSHLNKDNMIIF